MARRRQLRSPRPWWTLLLVGAMAGGAGGQGPARIEIQFEALSPKLEAGKPPERLQLRIGGKGRDLGGEPLVVDLLIPSEALAPDLRSRRPGPSARFRALADAPGLTLGREVKGAEQSGAPGWTLWSARGGGDDSMRVILRNDVVAGAQPRPTAQRGALTEPLLLTIPLLPPSPTSPRLARVDFSAGHAGTMEELNELEVKKRQRGEWSLLPPQADRETPVVELQAVPQEGIQVGDEVTLKARVKDAIAVTLRGPLESGQSERKLRISDESCRERSKGCEDSHKVRVFGPSLYVLDAQVKPKGYDAPVRVLEMVQLNVRSLDRVAALVLNPATVLPGGDLEARWTVWGRKPGQDARLVWQDNNGYRQARTMGDDLEQGNLCFAAPQGRATVDGESRSVKLQVGSEELERRFEIRSWQQAKEGWLKADVTGIAAAERTLLLATGSGLWATALKRPEMDPFGPLQAVNTASPGIERWLEVLGVAAQEGKGARFLALGRTRGGKGTLRLVELPEKTLLAPSAPRDQEVTLELGKRQVVELRLPNQMCLEVEPAAFASRQERGGLQQAPCTGEPNQIWEWDGTGHMIAGHGLCLTGVEDKDGAAVWVDGCEGGSLRKVGQEWRRSERQQLIRHWPDKPGGYRPACIDVHGVDYDNKRHDGSRVQIWDCNAKKLENQTWRAYGVIRRPAYDLPDRFAQYHRFRLNTLGNRVYITAYSPSRSAEAEIKKAGDRAARSERLDWQIAETLSVDLEAIEAGRGGAEVDEVLLSGRFLAGDWMVAAMGGALYALDQSADLPLPPEAEAEKRKAALAARKAATSGLLLRFRPLAQKNEHGTLEYPAQAAAKLQEAGSLGSLLQGGVPVDVGGVLVLLGAKTGMALRQPGELSADCPRDDVIQDLAFNPQNNRWAGCGHALDVPVGSLATYLPGEYPRLWVVHKTAKGDQAATMAVDSPRLFARSYLPGNRELPPEPFGRGQLLHLINRSRQPVTWSWSTPEIVSATDGVRGTAIGRAGLSLGADGEANSQTHLRLWHGFKPLQIVVQAKVGAAAGEAPPLAEFRFDGAQGWSLAAPRAAHPALIVNAELGPQAAGEIELVIEDTPNPQHCVAGTVQRRKGEIVCTPDTKVLSGRYSTEVNGWDGESRHYLCQELALTNRDDLIGQCVFDIIGPKRREARLRDPSDCQPGTIDNPGPWGAVKSHYRGAMICTRRPIVVPRYGGLMATASTVEKGELDAGRAVDGDVKTRWGSAFGAQPQWLTVDLGAVKAISDVVIRWEAAHATDYELRVSDDQQQWRTIEEVVGEGGGNAEHRSLKAKGRYLRILCKKRSGEYGYSIYEVEVYGPKL